MPLTTQKSINEDPDALTSGKVALNRSRVDYLHAHPSATLFDDELLAGLNGQAIPPCTPD